MKIKKNILNICMNWSKDKNLIKKRKITKKLKKTIRNVIIPKVVGKITKEIKQKV